MKALILSVGTRGDVQPFVALGKGLQAAGHKVTVCTCERFQSFITDHGLDYGYLSDAILQLIDSDEGRDAMENTTNVWESIKTYRKLISRAGPIQTANLDEMWTCAQECDPDVILFHPKAFGGLFFAEKLAVPAILATLFPLFAPTAEFPAFGFPNIKLGGWYNKLSYRVVAKLIALGGNKYFQQWRKKENMPRRARSGNILRESSGRLTPILHGYSRHIIPRPADWPDSAEVTGSWFLDENDSWRAPADLKRFLDAGDPPVYVGFGSMSGRNPARLTRIVVDALSKANVRGVLATGWGGLDARSTPNTVFQIEQAPHDWLFPRMAAVVHHGGAGTTAAGLRAGRPTVICPFFGDQPAWGRRIRAIGAGVAPLPQKKLNAPRLAAAIREVTTNSSIREAADQLGRKLRREDGVGNAVAFIERIVAESSGSSERRSPLPTAREGSL